MSALRGWEWLIVLAILVFVTVVVMGVVVGLVVWAQRRGSRPPRPEQPGPPPTA